MQTDCSSYMTAQHGQ